MSRGLPLLVAFIALRPLTGCAAVDSISALEKAAATRPAAGIMDNSFLVEEAYNQEPGVVQHILNVAHSVTRHRGPDDREWDFAFTQEWPFLSQTHQLSFTLPYALVESGGRSQDGINDISLHYRYQVLLETERTPAFAPSFSLILPTGNAANGFGDDTVGYQINLPLSKIVSDRWTLHANAGVTYLPDVGGHDLVSYNLAASAIYAVTPTFNLMLEAVSNFDDAVNDFDRTERSVSAVISPGARYAFNHSNDAQTVIGIAVPIGITSDAPDYGIFLYASFEHFFFRPKSIVAEK